MDSHPGSIFERNPIKTLAGVWLLVITFVLALDFFISNFVIGLDTMGTIQESARPMGYDNKKSMDVRWGTRPWNAVKFRLNNYGFRDRSDLDVASLGSRRLLVALGDSTTAAFESPVSYTDVVSEILGPEFRVVNAGVRAYDTHQVILKYQTVVRPLKPFAVIYMICFNDFSANAAEIRPESADVDLKYGVGRIDKHGGVHWLPPAAGLAGLRLSLLEKFQRNFRITSRIVNAARAVMNPATDEQIPERTWRDQVTRVNESELAEMKRLLRYFADVTSRDGVELFISYFPDIDDDNRLVRSRNAERIGSFVQSELKNVTFLQVHDQVEGIATGSGSRFRISQGDMHAGEFGNVAIGRTIGDLLRMHFKKEYAGSGGSAIVNSCVRPVVQTATC